MKRDTGNEKINRVITCLILLLLHEASCMTITNRKKGLLKSVDTTTPTTTNTCSIFSRYSFLKYSFASMTTFPFFITPSSSSPAHSRNLPENYGADLSKTGDFSKLVPIISMKESLLPAKSLLSTSRNEMKNGNISTEDAKALLDLISRCTKTYIPENESDFKKNFDEYSDPIGYKEKFMDNNAFLVYYTNGYDGPNRKKLEDSSYVSKQSLQYGARNDAWSAWNDVLSEISYIRKSSNIFGSASSSSSLYVDSTYEDVLEPLTKTLGALDQYLLLAPEEDVKKANNLYEK